MFNGGRLEENNVNRMVQCRSKINETVDGSRIRLLCQVGTYETTRVWKGIATRDPFDFGR